MSAALARAPLACEPVTEYGAALAPPWLELRPYARRELWERFRGGEREAEDCERWLATASRARAALDLAIAEGLAALRAGDRLPELGFHLGDYAREVLGIEERTALGLVRLARELRTRPLLREALRAGRVGFRAAQVILPVAAGEAETFWVELASRETVRALEKRVAAARGGADGAEEWGRVDIPCRPEEREIIDAALEVAATELPGARRFERLEAIAQEYLAEFPEAEDAARPWDEIVGHCAHIVRESRIHQLLGFASFRHYVEERLGLPARAVEQRAALEKRMWQSPALREARAHGLSYEKLRALARLPEQELAAALERARAVTCIALRRELEAREEGQMRAARRLAAPAPRRVACTLAAAIRAVRARVGRPIPAGTCLAILAAVRPRAGRAHVDGGCGGVPGR